jgi:hypothetical protein
MPRRKPPPTPTPPLAPLDHTDARMQAQIKKLQAVFADQLVEAFDTMMQQSAREPESVLGMITLTQREELLACLRETVTQPPPEFAARLSHALDTIEEKP